MKLFLLIAVVLVAAFFVLDALEPLNGWWWFGYWCAVFLAVWAALYSVAVRLSGDAPAGRDRFYNWLAIAFETFLLVTAFVYVLDGQVFECLVLAALAMALCRLRRREPRS